MLKRLLILFFVAILFGGCTEKKSAQGPVEERRFFATGFVREHGPWLCGNDGFMLEHYDCLDCPELQNDIRPISGNGSIERFVGRYVGVEGFWQADSLNLCPKIVVESIEEIPVRYRCGDVNHDWQIDTMDFKMIINSISILDPPFIELQTGDTNCDGTVNLSDAVFIINYIYLGVNAPCDTDNDGIPDCGSQRW